MLHQKSVKLLIIFVVFIFLGVLFVFKDDEDVGYSIQRQVKFKAIDPKMVTTVATRPRECTCLCSRAHVAALEERGEGGLLLGN